MPSPSPARRVTRNGGARNAGQYAPSGSAGSTGTRGGGARQPPPARRRATPSPRRGAPNQSARARSPVPDPGDDDDAVHGVGLVKLINLCGKLGIDDDQVDGTRDSASSLFALVIAALPAVANPKPFDQAAFRLALREGRRADWLQLLADNRKLVDTVVSAVRAKSAAVDELIRAAENDSDQGGRNDDSALLSWDALEIM